jgi:hypothetical protein
MIVSPCKSGQLDPPVDYLLREVDVSVPMVQTSAFYTYPDYTFNEDLYRLDKWVLVDFGELGANRWDMKHTFLWGKNGDDYLNINKNEWAKFNEFVRNKPPVVYFKRELLSKDFGGNVHPISFPGYWACPVQTKQEFDARPIDVFNSWGYSHELRRMLHGEIFINAVRRNRTVIDNYAHLEQELRDHRKKWVSVITPHYARMPMSRILEFQGQSKLSMSLPGAGITCFRHTEACVNSVMVMRDDKLKWSYGWTHNVNCIKFPVGEDMDSIRGMNGAKEAIESCEEALQNPELYDIYLAGVETCEKYQIKNYVTNYIEKIINEYL